MVVHQIHQCARIDIADLSTQGTCQSKLFHLTDIPRQLQEINPTQEVATLQLLARFFAVRQATESLWHRVIDRGFMGLLCLLALRLLPHLPVGAIQDLGAQTRSCLLYEFFVQILVPSV